METVLINILENGDFIQKVIERVNFVFEKNMNAKIKETEERHLKEIKNLREKVDSLEQNSRSLNLRINGVPEDQRKKPDDDFKGIMMKLGIQQITPKECFRIGKTKSNGKPRQLFIKLENHVNKVEIMKNRRKLKGTKIHINEDLTKYKLDLKNKASEKYGFRNVWSQNGRIFANINNVKTEIKTVDNII